MDSIEFTIENIENAVTQFYSDISHQKDINTWLTSAQVSAAAWTFTWELLSPTKKAFSILYVRSEVPAEEYPALRNRLFQVITTYACGGPRIVLTRLCVALSAMVLHMLPDIWPDAISDIIQAFNPHNMPQINPTQACCVLLEILKVLPEEFMTCHLLSSRRAVLRNTLCDNLRHVLPLLNQVLTQAGCPSDIAQQGLKCFSSWVQFGVSLQEGENLILLVIQALQSTELIEIAADALVTVFLHPDSHRYPGCIMKLLPHILSAKELLNRSFEENDQETSLAIFKLLVAIGENHTRILLQSTLEDTEHKKNVLELVHLILSCSSMPGYFGIDEHCSDLPFGFWYILQDEIFSADPEPFQVYLAIYRPVFLNLLSSFLVKVRFPSDELYITWTAEQKEQFRCYRQDVWDTIMYTYNILRDVLLQHLCSSLIHILSQPTHAEQWQAIESIVFAVGAVADMVDVADFFYLPQVFALLPQIPFTNLKLISTTLDTIGAYAEWISCHPKVLEGVIPLLLQGVLNAEVAPSASMALKDIACDCQPQVKPFAQDILKSCQEALMSGQLHAREQVRLMACIGRTLAVLPSSDIMSHLSTVLSPHVQELQVALLQQVKSTVVLKLNLLAMLCSSLDTRSLNDGNPTSISDEEPLPVLIILPQLLPLLKNTTSKWVQDREVVEAVCEVLNKSMHTLLDAATPVIGDITDLVVHTYCTVSHSSLVDLSKHLLLLFAGTETHRPTMMSLFCKMTEQTLKVLEKQPREDPAVMESFMIVLAQLFKKHPELLDYKDCNLSGLFHSGCVALAQAETPTVRHAVSFLNEFMMQRTKRPKTEVVVLSRGPLLLMQVLQAIGGASPRHLVDFMADILFSFNKHYSDYVGTWMMECINRDNFPSSRVSKANKEQFTRHLLRERTHRRKLREIVNEFSLLCRGLLGTEYANVTSVLSL